jgi:hypothetical protein
MMPALLPYDAKTIDDNDLPRCSSTHINICLNRSLSSSSLSSSSSSSTSLLSPIPPISPLLPSSSFSNTTIKYICPCKKQYYCSKACQRSCYKQHYQYCNEILSYTNKQQHNIINTTKLPINIIDSNVEPFIIVIQSWIVSLNDIWSLGSTCRLFHTNFHSYDHAKRIMMNNLEKLVIPFGFNSLIDFNSLLINSDAILAGSMPLQAITGDDYGIDSDMDIYIDKDTNQDIIRSKLIEMNYIEVIKETEYDYSYILGINTFDQSICNAVHTYKNRNTFRQIQLIYLHKNNIQYGNNDLGYIVCHYDFTFLFNWYNGHRFHILHAQDTFKKIGHFNKDILELLKTEQVVAIKKHEEENIPTIYAFFKVNQYLEKLLRRIKKYNSRGYVIVGKQPPKDIEKTPYDMW